MSIKLNSHAKSHKSLQLIVELLEGEICDELLITENWLLQKHHSGSGWQTPVERENISSVTTTSNNSLQFNFTHLGGLYRLECLYSAVDANFHYVYFKQYVSGRDPYYIVMEGLNFNGSNIIPAMYLDSSSLPSTLSQQLTINTGIATSGSMDISIVDLDGEITKALKHKSFDSQKNIITTSCAADDDIIYTTGNDEFENSGVAYIDNEAIIYNIKNADGSFSGLQRGAFDTIAQAHQAGQYISPYTSYFQGRHIWIKEPLSEDYSDSDRVIFSGTIDTVQPKASNLACYSISINDPLVYLNANIGRSLATANVFPQLYIGGEETGSGRRGNDTLYLRRVVNPDQGYDELSIRLSPGFYLSNHQSHGSKRNIASCLQEQINQAWVNVNCSITIDNDNKMSISFKAIYPIEILSSGFNKTNMDSILASLGFDEDKLIFNNSNYFSESNNSVQILEMKANTSIHKGVGSYNRRIYLEDNLLQNYTLEKFNNGHLARIEDELIYYEGVFIPDPDNIVSSSLTDSIDFDETILFVADNAEFPATGAIIKIDDELMYFNQSHGDKCLSDCTRGVWGTTATNHLADATVSLIDLPYIYSCVRGIYGTTAIAHDSKLVEQIISSDKVSQPVPGNVEMVRAIAGEFLLSLLDDTETVDCASAGLPEQVLNKQSFIDTSQNSIINYDGTFLRLIYNDESFHDVVSDICKSLNLYLYINRQGKITLGKFKPRLKHQHLNNIIDQDSFVSAPQIEWREDLRINRAEINLDYNSINDEYETSIILDDQSLPYSPLKAETEMAFELNSKSVHTKNHSGTGGGEGYYYDLAWSIIKQFNRPITTVSVSVLPSAAAHLEILSSVQLNSPALPSGNGLRGIASVNYDVIEIEESLSENKVTLSLLERSNHEYGGIAPSSSIIDYDSETNTLTIAKDDFWPDDLDPADIFHEGDTIEIKYLSYLQAGIYRESESLIISTEGVDTSNWSESGIASLTVNSDPDLLPQNGDLVIASDYGNNPESILQDFVYLADDNDLLNNTDEAFVYSY